MAASLIRATPAPTSLSAIGASKDDIPALAAAAMVDVCAGGNPREAKPTTSSG